MWIDYYNVTIRRRGYIDAHTLMKTTTPLLIPLFAAVIMSLFGWALTSNSTQGHSAPLSAFQAPNPPIHLPTPSAAVRGQAAEVVNGPHILLTKTVGLDHGICSPTNAITVSANTEVVYCYFVTNIGTEGFQLHNVDDDKLGELQDRAAFELTAANGVQPAALFTVATQITQTTLNLATWTAFVEAGASASATSTATVNVPAILLTKTVSLDPNECWHTSALTVTAGTTVYYCYSVQNVGNVSLQLHSLIDEELGPLWSDRQIDLAPQEILRSVDFGETYSQTVTQDTVGPAVGRATTGDGAQALAETETAVRVPSISVSKTVGTDPDRCATENQATVLIGDQVIYCYTVENTGRVTLTSHDVWDSEFGVLLDNAQFTLSPGAIGLFTITAEITGSVSTSVTWMAGATATLPGTATFPAGRTVPVTATASANAFVNINSLASFTAVIFRDINGNGIQDSEEPGLPGAVVTLEHPSAEKIMLEADETGVVTFDDLEPGMYTATVEVGLPSGAELTTDNLPSNVDLTGGQKAQAAFGYKTPFLVLLPLVRK